MHLKISAWKRFCHFKIKILSLEEKKSSFWWSPFWDESIVKISYNMRFMYIHEAALWVERLWNQRLLIHSASHHFLLVRPAALIHLLASSFTRYRDHGKLNWMRWSHIRSTRSGLGPQQNKSHAVGRGQWCKNRPENANKNNCERAWHFTCRSLSKVISLEKESSR